MKLAQSVPYRIAVLSKDGHVLHEVYLYGETLALQQYHFFIQEEKYRSCEIILVTPMQQVQQACSLKISKEKP